MSNSITVSRLEVHNLDDGDVTLALRVSDSYDDYLNNDLGATLDFDPANGLPEDDMELFRMLCKLSQDAGAETLWSLITSMVGDSGVTIGGNYYETTELKPIFEEVCE